MEQMTIEDWMPEACPKNVGVKEPEVGEIIHKHGQVICHIMRPHYIGKKVCFDISTESQRNLFRVGILEKYVPHEETYRSIVYTGTRQRSLINHRNGRTIYECLPWDQYPERMEMIGSMAEYMNPPEGGATDG